MVVVYVLLGLVAVLTVYWLLFGGRRRGSSSRYRSGSSGGSFDFLDWGDWGGGSDDCGGDSGGCDD